MDRPIVYPGAIPADTDFLSASRFAYIGLSALAQTILGSGTLLWGFGPVPANGLVLTMQPGFIYAPEPLDSNAYGSLPAVPGVVLKQGIYAGANYNCPAPTTAGQTINYLVEIALVEQDIDPVVLPFYDSSNPTIPYTGPNNTNAALATVRNCQGVVTVKAGASAATGSQVTPNPDQGCVGAYVVSVPYGATQLTAGMIAPYPNAPFLNETLEQKISEATGDARYQPIGNYQLATAHGSQTLTGTGTFTVPVNVYSIKVERWGGGAGGGGSTSNTTGTGGGSGSYGADIIQVTPGQQFNFACGVGGAAGTASSSGAAGNGAATTFGTLSSVAGGQGGDNGATGGGQGGVTPTGCQVALGGSPGQGGFAPAANIGGAGGTAPRGGVGGQFANGNPGNAGNGFGAGGGGAGSTTSSGFVGSAGQAGAAVVTW